MDIDLCWRNSRKITLFFIWISQCESAVFQINQPSDFAVRVVTMHTLLYSGHVRYDKNNDIMSPKVNTALLGATETHWSTFLNLVIVSWC